MVGAAVVMALGSKAGEGGTGEGLRAELEVRGKGSSGATSAAQGGALEAAVALAAAWVVRVGLVGLSAWEELVERLGSSHNSSTLRLEQTRTLCLCCIALERQRSKTARCW